MASLRQRPSRKPGGRPSWVIEFYPEPNRKREISVCSGDTKRAENHAREFFRHVEELERAKKLGDTVDIRTLQWVDTLDDAARTKLVRVELIIPRHKTRTAEQLRLGNFIQAYIDTELADSAENTKRNYAQMKNWLLLHFKEEQDVRTITPQELKRWQRMMANGVTSGKTKKSPLAIDTRNKHVQRVKTIFAAAVNDRVLTESPAAILREDPKPKRIDRSKQFFVSQELAAKMLQGLPDTNWRLIFCLLRYQGFRRNEVFQLEWSHIDWENSRMTVNVDRKKKTEARECPIFPETLPYLRDALEQAEPGSKVIRWTAKPESLTALLRKHVKRINAGVIWPKILQQLRSTRRTELEERFPAHVCDEWLGHDDETAKRHYKQVTPDHWATAANALQPQANRRICFRKPQASRANGTGLSLHVVVGLPPIAFRRSSARCLHATPSNARFTRQLPDCLTDSGVNLEPSGLTANGPKNEKTPGKRGFSRGGGEMAKTAKVPRRGVERTRQVVRFATGFRQITESDRPVTRQLPDCRKPSRRIPDGLFDLAADEERLEQAAFDAAPQPRLGAEPELPIGVSDIAAAFRGPLGDCLSAGTIRTRLNAAGLRPLGLASKLAGKERYALGDVAKVLFATDGLKFSPKKGKPMAKPKSHFEADVLEELRKRDLEESEQRMLLKMIRAFLERD